MNPTPAHDFPLALQGAHQRSILIDADHSLSILELFDQEGNQGLPDSRDGIEMRRAELRMGGSLLFSFLAGACLRLNRPDEGLAAADAGLAHCRDTSEGLFEAELWRLRGECILRGTAGETATLSSTIQEAMECFAKAQALAHAQRAHMLERRASRGAARITALPRPPA